MQLIRTPWEGRPMASETTSGTYSDLLGKNNANDPRIKAMNK